MGCVMCAYYFTPRTKWHMQAKLYTAKSLLVHMIQLSACSHDSKVITTYAIVHSINDPSLISLTFYHP